MKTFDECDVIWLYIFLKLLQDDWDQRGVWMMIHDYKRWVYLILSLALAKSSCLHSIRAFNIRFQFVIYEYILDSVHFRTSHLASPPLRILCWKLSNMQTNANINTWDTNSRFESNKLWNNLSNQQLEMNIK